MGRWRAPSVIGNSNHEAHHRSSFIILGLLSPQWPFCKSANQQLKDVSYRQRSGECTLGQWAGGAEQVMRASARACEHAMR